MARNSSEAGPHPVDRHVGRRVCEKRVALGYNQGDLGRAIGLTFQQVQKYEKGTNRISSSKLWEIANFLEVDIGYFFDGLARDRPAGAVPEPAPNRRTVELARLAPRLSNHQQKLALHLIRAIVDRSDH